MQPLFISDPSGSLFCIYYAPAGKPIKRAIMHVPAFAEEMNKSRRMVALQARDLVQQGVAVLVLDLFGTGDSAGDFGEASWQIWLRNISTAVTWLHNQGIESIDLWGLRAGALLAMDWLGHNPAKVEHLLCWQPVVNGETFIMQFLRLRMAATMMNSSAPQDKTSDLKRQLLDGRALEVAGYRLNPDLAVPLMALRAEQMHLQNVNGVAIFEIAANSDSPIAAPTMHFAAKLHENGIKASLEKIVGDAFWATQDISTAPNLIEQTSKKVESWL